MEKTPKKAPCLILNQRKAIAALISNRTLDQAAAACGLSRRTLYRYMQNPEFSAALAVCQAQTVRAAQAALVGTVGIAINGLIEIIESEDESGANKVRAALGILDRAGRGQMANKSRGEIASRVVEEVGEQLNDEVLARLEQVYGQVLDEPALILGPSQDGPLSGSVS